MSVHNEGLTNQSGLKIQSIHVGKPHGQEEFLPVNSSKMGARYQIITSTFWVFVHTNYGQVISFKDNTTYCNMHQLREQLRNSSIILPNIGKLILVSQVMTRDIVTTN